MPDIEKIHKLLNQTKRHHHQRGHQKDRLRPHESIDWDVRELGGQPCTTSR